MQTLKQQKQTKFDNLLNECKIFFAFSNEQFEKNKTELKDGEKYVSIHAGGYMPKSYLDSYLNGTEEINEWYKREVRASKDVATKEILYELHNYECFYVDDISEVVSLFKGTFTAKQIQKVYSDNYETATANL